MWSDRELGYNHWNLKDYFFGEIRDERQYFWQSFVSGLPIISAYTSARDNSQYMRDYMRNRALDWGDIKYSSRTTGWGMSGAINFVSSNVKKLYR